MSLLDACLLPLLLLLALFKAYSSSPVREVLSPKLRGDLARFCGRWLYKEAYTEKIEDQGRVWRSNLILLVGK